MICSLYNKPDSTAVFPSEKCSENKSACGSGKEDLPEKRHREIECRRLKPDTDKTGLMVFLEQKRGDKTHSRAHKADRQRASDQKDKKERHFLCGNAPGQCHNRPLHDEHFQNNGSRPHDPKFSERHQEHRVLHPADIKGDVVADHGVYHKKRHHDSENEVFKLLQQISRLRNQVRWATNYYGIECSVLGHLFDTAVFAYLMAYDETGGDETFATKMFFMGIWHDVAEAWTKDIPSPIKNRIDGDRKATEKFELIKLNERVYSVLPDYLTKAIKEVMLEEEVNTKCKDKVKAADYLSAASECWRQIISGTHDSYFSKAILGEIKHLSPAGEELHEAFKKVARHHLQEVEAYLI